ncbi:MAG: sortase, partial [Chloroflexota bacterium]
MDSAGRHQVRLALWGGRLFIALGCFMTLAGLGYIGVVNYLNWQEQASPSTSRVLVLKDGTRIELQQPTHTPRHNVPPLVTSTSMSAPAANSTPTVASAQGAQTAQTSPDVTAPTATATIQSSQGIVQNQEPQILPPVRLSIPEIGLNLPIVLSNGKQLPRFKGIGWLLGSAFPGDNGNFVLFGHLDGQYATLGRLKELEVGDIFSVSTDNS